MTQHDRKAWDILILGGARDFHAMDWYRAIKRICTDKKVVFATDSFEAEGFKDLSEPSDDIQRLLIIDPLMPKKLGRYSHAWRNLIKLILAPYQAIKLKKMHELHGKPVVHAHPMYFMLLCTIARIPFIGTPQGDELLIRPNKSKIYYKMARWILRHSTTIIVDSDQMKQAARKIAGVEAHIIQNGINVTTINSVPEPNEERFRIVSNRGMAELYRIDKILQSRDKCLPNQPLTFTYPFSESEYYTHIKKKLKPIDIDLGRLDKKEDLYSVLKETLLVVSIPSSDSSPRSVYEAIFCGCCIAAPYNPWIDNLPPSMKERVYIADLEDPNWLKKAYQFAKNSKRKHFSACNKALEAFDEDYSLRKAINEFYLCNSINSEKRNTQASQINL